MTANSIPHEKSQKRSSNDLYTPNTINHYKRRDDPN